MTKEYKCALFAKMQEHNVHTVENLRSIYKSGLAAYVKLELFNLIDSPSSHFITRDTKNPCVYQIVCPGTSNVLYVNTHTQRLVSISARGPVISSSDCIIEEYSFYTAIIVDNRTQVIWTDVAVVEQELDLRRILTTKGKTPAEYETNIFNVMVERGVPSLTDLLMRAMEGSIKQQWLCEITLLMASLEGQHIVTQVDTDKSFRIDINNEYQDAMLVINGDGNEYVYKYGQKTSAGKCTLEHCKGYTSVVDENGCCRAIWRDDYVNHA